VSQNLTLRPRGRRMLRAAEQGDDDLAQARDDPTHRRMGQPRQTRGRLAMPEAMGSAHWSGACFAGAHRDRLRPRSGPGSGAVQPSCNELNIWPTTSSGGAEHAASHGLSVATNRAMMQA
jgi:hypothetical protein